MASVALAIAQPVLSQSAEEVNCYHMGPHKIKLADVDVWILILTTKGWSGGKIAEELGTTEGAAHTRLYRLFRKYSVLVERLDLRTPVAFAAYLTYSLGFLALMDPHNGHPSETN